MKLLKSALIAGGLILTAGVAQACNTDIAKSELTDEQVAELYTCIEAKLLTSYQKSGRAEADAFRDWFMPSTTPFVSATHGNRFVNHYVNEIGREAYMTFNEEDLVMPVGSITAKESYTINKEGKVIRGPLFLMEKMELAGFEATDAWKYTVILPNGKIMGETGAETGGKVKFCHDCHINVIEEQDGMFYPDEDYRVAAN